MKEKLRDYIDTIFADAPATAQARDLKEEILNNLYEKYDALIAQGRTESAAFNASIAGIGDVSELIGKLGGETKTEYIGDPAPAEPVREAPEMTSYRRRSALLTSIAIALYILCVVPVIIIQNVAGVVLMFVFIAAATCMLIFNSMTKPNAVKRAENGDPDESIADKNPLYKAISGALWMVTVCIFLGVSFYTGKWGVTWLIFLISAAIDHIIKAIFEIRR